MKTIMEQVEDIKKSAEELVELTKTPADIHFPFEDVSYRQVEDTIFLKSI